MLTIGIVGCDSLKGSGKQYQMGEFLSETIEEAYELIKNVLEGLYVRREEYINTDSIRVDVIGLADATRGDSCGGEEICVSYEKDKIDIENIENFEYKILDHNDKFLRNYILNLTVNELINYNHKLAGVRAYYSTKKLKSLNFISAEDITVSVKVGNKKDDPNNRGVIILIDLPKGLETFLNLNEKDKTEKEFMNILQGSKNE